MIRIELPETIKKEVVLWETDRPSHVLELDAIVVTCKVACQVIFKKQSKEGKESEVLISPIVCGYAPTVVIPMFREQVGGRQRLAVEVIFGTDTKREPVEIILINTRK